MTIMSMENCWEVLKCGREPGGTRVDERGPCVATTFVPADGFLGGVNGGRACMFLSGTLCHGSQQRTAEEKEEACQKCKFHRRLTHRHGNLLTRKTFMRYIQHQGNRPGQPMMQERESLVEGASPIQFFANLATRLGLKQGQEKLRAVGA